MNEIVKYDNYMNNISFKRFTTTDFNFLMVLCNKLRDKDIAEIVISFQELKQKTEYKQTSIDKFVSDLERMNKKLMEITCRLKTESKIIMFVLFPTFEIDLENQLLVVSVNQKFKFILNELIKNFTRFEMNEFVRLDSKYTKNLYRLLKQYRCTGRYEVNIEKFRDVMDIPKSYTNRDVMRKVIKVSLQELQRYFHNLQCEAKYAHKRGKPVTGYIFTFSPEAVAGRSDNPKPGQEKKGESRPGKSGKPKTAFHNFQQREYDYAELERELLNHPVPGQRTDGPKEQQYLESEIEAALKNMLH